MAQTNKKKHPKYKNNLISCANFELSLMKKKNLGRKWLCKAWIFDTLQCKNSFYGKTKHKFKSNTLHVSEEL